MGAWQLEIFKMAIYIAFPVALFHYFNSPGNIDDALATEQSRLIGDVNIAKKEIDFKRALDDISRAQFNK